ncbi:MAG: alpha/beta hydrolase [Halothiobacillaceae bacterium]
MLRVLCLALSMLMSAWTVQAAEPVELPHGDLTLVGHMERAPATELSDGVVLIVHGTLAHGEMEITRSLQELLAEAGYNALTINLGLGQDRRTGMYDCDSLHDHGHEDAVGEIAAWVDWLREQGAGRVAIVGHSRGGNQVARYLADDPDPVVTRGVLLAPQTWSEDDHFESYEKSHGVPLEPLLEQARRHVAQGDGDRVMSLDFIYCPDAKATARSVVSYYEPDPRMDTPTVIAETAVPTLVLVAELDEVVTDLETRMDGRVDEKTVFMSVIGGADHMFMDLFVYDVADQTAAFLDW